MLWIIFIIISTVTVQDVFGLFNNYSGNNVGRGSCRHRSIRQAEFHSISTGRSMSESFVLDDVEYKLSKYHVTWDEALVFCSSHKARLATLDNEEKTAFVVQAIASSSSVSEDYWIGARKLYGDPWTWNSNGMRMNSENEIINDYPVWYPGLDSNDDLCLTIDRTGHDEPIFVPRACNQRRGFICQRDNDRALDNKIRMVAATRVGEQEFRLYAGKATWVEAVVLCRHEGLQIGEVNTQEEARAVAISMLRNRPEGIENAWIGGYTRVDDPITWRWLASGKLIKNEDMWRKNLSESSGGCLLLDRHVCESPVYVESACDRKRDVLCQKPPKKRINKNPVAVFVEGCPYWIGFYPLKWSDARLSCESLNSTLVVLDSPATITHMMRLMLDNKAELRHIWTDGRRSKNNGHWEWAITGESIPDFAKSFIPWCPEDDYYTIDNACLNLDRENLDSPLVYGLSCREKQTYVCQPRIGDCVVHSTRKNPPEVNEDIKDEKTFKFSPFVVKNLATLPMSTVTTPFPMVNVNYGIIQTTLRDQDDRLANSITQKSEENVNVKNSTSGIDFSQYLTSFSRFTLPSLPQFGIKVVSAVETTTNSISYEVKKKKSKVFKYHNNSSQPQIPTIVSTLPVAKKVSLDTRKSSKISIKTLNASNSHDFNVNQAKIVNSSRPTQVSLHSKSSLSPKNSYKSTSGSKSFSTTSTMLQEELASSTISDTSRTKKYSIKTTRDLYSSNETKLTTTKAPEMQNIEEKKIQFNSKELLDNLPPKSVVVGSIPVKNLRLNSAIGTRRKQTLQVTTPYDAVDEDYYDDEDDKSSKKTVDEETKDSEEFSDYSEEYESTTKGKKKSKKIGKNERKIQIKSPEKEDDEIEDEDEEEEEEEEEEEKEKDESTTKSTIPIVEDLSKNLENALMNMMRQGLEKKRKENSQVNMRREQDDKKLIKSASATWIKEEADDNNIKSLQMENFSLRPYYAFEGPFVVAFKEDPKNALHRAGDNQIGRDREFRFVGKKLSDENYRVEKKLTNNGTRRMMKQPSPRSPQNNLPISMAEMPPIQPNDPSSLMQLGRYFKNKFGNLVQNSDDRRQLMSSRDDLEQRRYGRPLNQDRLREFSANREEDVRKKGHRWTERQRRPGIRELEKNYYQGNRRLYPRGNYDIYGAINGRESEINEKRLRDERERLRVAWPDKNFSNYDNFDQLNRAVSPRSFPLPIRTTRSFHDDNEAKKNDIANGKILPDFRLSKLVKEVKIDLDQRMLKRYLESFARKMSNGNAGTKGDRWKGNWRELLGQVLSVFDKMNINVNGNVMKLRAENDDRENELSVEDSRDIEWKSGSRKQRKDTPNNAIKNFFSQKINNTLMKKSGNHLENEKSDKIKIISGHNYQRFEDKSLFNDNKRPIDYSDISRRLPQFFQTKYSNFNNSQINRGQHTIIPLPRLSNVFRYHPIVPQLQRRIIFRPRWPQIRANPIPKKTFYNGENLPEGTLSRIVGSEYNNEHFGRKNYLDGSLSGNLTGKLNNSDLEKSIKSSIDDKTTRERKINDFHSVSMISGISHDSRVNEHQKSIENDNIKKISVTDNTKETEIRRNKSSNGGSSGYYNVSIEQSNNREISEERHEDENNNNNNHAEDYERKPVWSPAHRLTKALELSVLRKFGGNSANSMRSKNLVTRSVKDTEAIKNSPYIEKETIGYDRRLKDNTDEEPSVVSLRMIMNPVKKSSRISRQSPAVANINPRTIELRVQFTGNKETTEENQSKNQLIREDMKNKTLQEFSINNKNLSKAFGNLDSVSMVKKFDNIGVKRPIRFIDKERKRAMINRLRDQSVNLNKNYLRSYATSGQNITNVIDRKSRNIGVGKKNSLNYAKSMKEAPAVKHYIATSLRNFEDKNLTDKWQKAEKSDPIDWAEEASALFTDLKETSDDLTLYIDLTLGRVGSKPRNGGRSRG